MLAETMFDQGHLTLMKKALSAYALRHKVVSDNLANVDTAGFRSRAVDFETALAEAGRSARPMRGLRTHAGHLTPGEARDPAGPVVRPVDAGFANGVNDVDVDREMGEMVKNHLAYRLATRLLSRKYEGLHTAITGTVR